MNFRRIGKFLGDLIYPDGIKCIFCGDELNGLESNETCARCYSALPFIQNACPRCGVSMPNNDGVCMNCKNFNYDFDTARAAVDYTGMVVNIIHNFKYNNQPYLARPLADYMCDVYANWNITPDYVCPVPSHKTRLKQRGYNQAELLARAFVKRFKLHYADLCLKIKETPNQASLPFKKRRTNLIGSFAVNPACKKLIKNKIILLVDDIVTTGSTASEVAKVLKQAGAKQVHVLSIAHTPAPEIPHEDN